MEEEPDQMQHDEEILGSTESSSSEDDTTDSEDEGQRGDTKDENENEEEMGNDEEILAQLSDTNYKLSGDPFSYDLYVEKIKLLSRLGDAEALRETREKLTQLYPLNEKLWLDWIHDEMGSGGRAKVTELFDRAVKDYLSIDIWLEYVQFRLGDLTQENGIEGCRQLFERALSSGGLHVPMGAVLWDMYREFEGAVLGMTDPSKLEEQEQRYISLCKRQLAVPLFGLQNTYKQLKSKINIDDAAEANYKAALEKLKAVNEWEEKLVDENIESKVETYKQYLEAEKQSKSNPARRICLYERAVADNPLESSLWLDFYEYTLGINLEDMSLDVITRASRNCPWTISIWTNYLCHLEQHGVTKEQIKETFEKAILYCSTGEQAGTLWLKYLEILKRRINFSNPEEADIKLFDKTLQAAEQHLRQLLEEPNDYVCQLLLFQARTKTHIAKSMEGSKDNWLEIFKRGYGSQFKVWLHAFNLEKQYGAGEKELRKRFEKGLTSVKDYPMLVVDLWLNYERDFGDVKSLRHCESKIEKWVKKAEEEYQNQSQTQTNNKFVPNKRREGLGFKRQRFGQKDQVPEKRGKFDPKPAKERKPLQSMAVDEPDQGEFKVPFAPKKSATERTDDQRSSGSAKKTPTAEYKPEEWKMDPKNNERTVFVSNLDKYTDDAKLQEFFSDLGIIENIRIARDFKGDSKKYGYVCFGSKDDAQKAIGKDRQPLNGRPVFVSKCNPDKSARSAQAPIKFRTGLEKDKLFVKGIPVTTKAEEVRQLFETHAKVKECRLVTYRNGESKGLAYVDFFDDESARLALSKTDGLEFQGSTLMVAFSNPPRKPAKDDEFAGPSMRRAPTMFVPRSLQLGSKAGSSSKPEVAPTSAGKPPNASGAPMSNDDFRNLFKK